jgi:hypothetical protein
MAPATTDQPGWEALIARVRAGPGTDARHEAGAWAMGQVRTALGERWPRQWSARFGTLPAFVRDPASDAFAYAQLLETGLRLHNLAGALRLRSVVRQWSRHLDVIGMRHAWIQMEVAALAKFLGADAEFEAPFQLPGAERPADVVITARDAGKIIAECFCIYSDLDNRKSMAYDQQFGRRLNMTTLDVRLSGHYDVRLPEDETEQLLAEIGQAAAEVQADGIQRQVTRPGIEIHLAPWSDPSHTEATLKGPTTQGAEWRRANGIIHGKAQDWAGSPAPTWLRIDLLDGTWLFSNWAQLPLQGKAEWMAALMAEATAGTDVEGVVISCGARLDTASPDETYADSNGITGLRRRLDSLRTRETIIVPLSTTGADHAPLWSSLYSSEPHWLGDALMQASLPPLEEIVSGWSPSPSP